MTRSIACCFPWAVAAAVLLGTASAAGAGDRRPERPNVLWITCEDISPNLGCYGDSYARTPVLDALSAEGVRYTEAYGITGVCAPNRSCLITGVYPSTLGSHGMRSTTRLPGQVKCFGEYLRAAGYYVTNNVKTDYNFPTPKTAWDESSRKAHWRKRKEGQPFFSVFNFTVCHESQIRQADASFFKKTERLTSDQRHDPARVSIPPFHPDTPEVRQDWARYHDLITAMDYQAGDVLQELEEDGLAEETIVFFFSDHGAGMPGCKKWVWESGLHVPLVVRFPEKYRRWSPGEPGSASDRLVSFVDFGPTVLSLAGVEIPPHMQGRAFLGPQAAQPREYVYAIRDRMAERYDTVRVVRDRRYQYMRNYAPQVTWSQFISYTEEMPTMKVWRRLFEEGKLDTVQARYFSPTKPVEELYDTKADPHQIRNLAGDSAHRSALERMRAASAVWMKQTHDLGLLPEYEVHRRAEGCTPYAVGHDARLNPLDRLLPAADLANRAGVEDLAEVVRLLDDDEPAVRYWGATGLVTLGDAAAPAAEALMKALEDPAPNVRIAAAEALSNVGRLDEAMPVLIAGLKHPTPFIRLRAMNVLDRLGERARPAVSAMKQARLEAKSHVGGYVGRMVEYVPKKLGAPEE
ncbi:MAG: sulfatase-like hydrolase/transferase [Planctomycetes bacterium]|nr:sulfatase-like hydrolase/transferase [Planctomycetota bacterium]